jgi:hypothetical protein
MNNIIHAENRFKRKPQITGNVQAMKAGLFAVSKMANSDGYPTYRPVPAESFENSFYCLQAKAAMKEMRHFQKEFLRTGDMKTLDTAIIMERTVDAMIEGTT